MRRLVGCAVFASAVLALLSACSAAPPDLVRIDARLEHVHDLDRDLWYEQIVLFALVRDQDGFGDIEQLYLLHDDEQLYWRLDGESWIDQRLSGEDWIGTAGLVMASGLPLPRGSYRVVVLDAGGQQDERRIWIDAPTRGEIAGRAPRVSEGIVEIRHGGALLRIVSTTRDDEPPRDVPLPPGEHPVAALIPADSVGFLSVQLDDYSGIVSGPVRP